VAIAVQFAILPALLLLAAIAFILGCRNCCNPLGFLLGLCLVLVWLALGVHMAAHKAVDDGCWQAGQYLAHPEEITSNTFALSCVQNNSFAVPINALLSDTQSEMSYLKNLTAAYGINISDELPPIQANLSATIVAYSNFIDDQAAIAESGIAQLPYPQNESSDIILIRSGLASVQNYTDVANSVSQYADCTYLLGLLGSLKDQYCSSIQGDVAMILAAEWALVPLIVLGTYFVLALFNHYHSPKGGGQPEVEGEVPLDEVEGHRDAPLSPDLFANRRSSNN